MSSALTQPQSVDPAVDGRIILAVSIRETSRKSAKRKRTSPRIDETRQAQELIRSSFLPRYITRLEDRIQQLERSSASNTISLIDQTPVR